MAWNLTGNSDATSSSFLGTTNVQPLIIKTNDAEALRVTPEGRVSIGNLGSPRSPDYRLDVQGILNADEIYKGGTPLVQSQWTTVGGGITYDGGEVGIGARVSGYRLNVDGTLNATDVHKGGTPLVGSQWEDESGGINYSGSSVGIGTINASYKLNVDGAVNASEYRRNGSVLVGSQWTNVSGVGIRYNASVGIGKAPASPYKLDVAGILNADEICQNGSSVISSQWAEASGGISYSGGNVGIGTTTPENAEEWNKVVDILGADAGGTKLSVRTQTVDAQMWAAAAEWWGAPAGMTLGTKSDHALSFATGGSSRMTIDPLGEVAIRGNVGIGRNLNVAGQLRWGNSVANPDSIELGAPDGSTPGMATPFIDFHFRGLSQDFNTRIINDADGQLTVHAAVLRARASIRWDNNSALRADQGGSLELGGYDDTPGAGTPYIDFHFRGRTQDFNTRIINDADGRLSIVAPTLNITGNIRFADGSVQTTASRLFIQSGEASPGALNTPQKPTQSQGVWVPFSVPFSAPPSVVLALKVLDTDRNFNQRIDVWPSNVTAQGFTANFRTWADTRIYLVGANWMAYGLR